MPGHFPNDPHGLGLFDGTHLYEHADPRQGYHQDWGTYIYNYGRQEVAAFLVANARFWLERYRLDGLRVDAVASMLYLDYSRKAGEWVPNRYGGNENLDAIDFLRRMNEVAYAGAPGVDHRRRGIDRLARRLASDLHRRPRLRLQVEHGLDARHAALHLEGADAPPLPPPRPDLRPALRLHRELHPAAVSHDEVVHGKGSLLGKMPGDRWQRFANLRAYFGFMWGHPGKKLLFMGGEFGQEREWNHDHSLDWHLLDDPLHRGVKDLLRDLNRAYRDLPALHERDCEAGGFQWLVSDDADNCVIAWARFGTDPGQVAIVISNFTPVPRAGYRLGVPLPGLYREVVNTDAAPYGGSSVGNMGGVTAVAEEAHGRPQSIFVTLPPLATIILDRQPD